MSGCIEKSASVSVTSDDLHILHTIQWYFLITAPSIGWRVVVIDCHPRQCPFHVIQNIVDSGVFGALWRGVTLGS